MERTNQSLEDRVRKRTEELSQSEGRLRMIVDTALDAVISIDGDGKIIGWNAQAERTFGWSSREVLDSRLSETIIPPQYREAHERGLSHFVATGQGPVLNRRIELTALNREGREFPIELAITPIPSGAQTHFSAFVRDITEPKRAEAKAAWLASFPERTPNPMTPSKLLLKIARSGVCDGCDVSLGGETSPPTCNCRAARWHFGNHRRRHGLLCSFPAARPARFILPCFNPQVDVWTSDAHPWDQMNPALPKFEK